MKGFWEQQAGCKEQAEGNSDCVCELAVRGSAGRAGQSGWGREGGKLQSSFHHRILQLSPATSL